MHSKYRQQVPIPRELSRLCRAAQKAHRIGEVGVEKRVVLHHRGNPGIAVEGGAEIGEPVTVVSEFAHEPERFGGPQEAQRVVAREIQTDDFSPTPQLLSALSGKDVVVVFVESYGRSAIEGASLRVISPPGIRAKPGRYRNAAGRPAALRELRTHWRQAPPTK